MIRTRALAASAPNGRLSARGIAWFLTHPAALPLSTSKQTGKYLVRQVCFAIGLGRAAGPGAGWSGRRCSGREFTTIRSWLAGCVRLAWLLAAGYPLERG